MHYAEDVHYTSIEDRGTLEPDQVQLVDEITDWINGDTTERIYFLCGPAECGKTSVARRVAHVFDRLQRLGSSYFVQEPLHLHTTHHNYPRYPSSIFRTISRDVADHNPYFRRAIGEMVNKRAIRSTNNIRAQFENFILYPAQRMSATGPVVIVIDALDYCGNKESREPLLVMLANRATELPPNFRILITSRPATDIVGAFKDKEHVIVKVLDTTLPDNDSGISFSPVNMCGKLSVTPPYDDDLEEPRNSSEDEDFLEGHEVYGLLSDYSYEGESDRYTDITLPFPLHAVEGPTSQVPPDKLIPPTRKQGMKLDEPPVILRGNALTRARTLHTSDARRPLKTVVATVKNLPNSSLEDTLYPEDSNGYAEGEWRAHGKRDVAASRSRGQPVSLQRAKSDRYARKTLDRDYCRPHPRFQMLVSRETYFIQ